MLSEERIKKMIRLSDYESGKGDEDLRRTKYSMKDYVRLQTLRTAAGMIAAGILIICMVLLYYIDRIPWSSYVSDGFFTINRILMISAILLVWLIILIIALVVTAARSRREYAESELRVNEYEETLSRLLQLYEAERKEESV